MGTTRHPRRGRHSIGAMQTDTASAVGSNEPRTRIAGWTSQLHSLEVEPARSRRIAHIGGIAAIGALLG
jgi:hypothetical protein